MTTNAGIYLPPEILSFIIAAVPSNFSLCNFALCSSLFYSLTVPVLYAHVHVYSRRHKFKRLRPLTVLFLTKPTLAQYVRRFTLRDPYQYYEVPVPQEYYDDHTNRSKTETLNVEDVLREAVWANSHSDQDFEKWMWSVSLNHPDALLAILLPTMGRLKKLDLMIRFGYWEYFERMVIRAVAHEKPFDRQPLFTTLTDFMHAASWELPSFQGFNNGQFNGRPWVMERVGFNYNIWFQRFPCVGSIFGHGITSGFDTKIPSTSRLSLAATGMGSSLTHLELKDSFVDPPSLCTILKVPKALSTFIYEISMTSDRDWHSDISPVDVLFALAPQYNTLENLWLDCLQFDAVTEHSNYVHDKTSLLSRFRTLKSFRVAAHVLFLLLYPDDDGFPFRRNFSRSFPATLESLHIRHEDELILWEDFRGFVLGELGQVPRLRKIFIECDSSIRAPVDWKDLQGHAKSQGVDLISLINDPLRLSNSRFERGWGMDGSIQWARCVTDMNQRDMPLVVNEWKEDLKEIYPMGWEQYSGEYFYKWHLCHEAGLEPDKQTADDEATDDTEQDDSELDESETDDKSDDDLEDEEDEDDDETSD
jgi:hypothetical protein